jgi:hypothetical protein
MTDFGVLSYIEQYDIQTCYRGGCGLRIFIGYLVWLIGGLYLSGVHSTLLMGVKYGIMFEVFTTEHKLEIFISSCLSFCTFF